MNLAKTCVRRCPARMEEHVTPKTVSGIIVFATPDSQEKLVKQCWTIARAILVRTAVSAAYQDLNSSANARKVFPG